MTAEYKTKLRNQAIVKRLGLASCMGASAAENAAQNFINLCLNKEILSQKNKPVVSGYLPMRSELNPLPLVAKLQNLGFPICMPVVVEKAKPLLFRLWQPDVATVSSPMGVIEPVEGEEKEPEILIVPLLAFDRKGYRLGFGGGFYDATIAALRKDGKKNNCVGFAFSGQEIAEVPRESFDERLDWIVTEKEAIKIKDNE